MRPHASRQEDGVYFSLVTAAPAHLQVRDISAKRCL
jgi:hypothetical protein